MRLFCYLLLIVLFSSCTPNNVNVDDSLGQYFKKHNTEGCFGLFNNGNGQFTIYNLPRYRDSSFLPASTFKIVNALVGLQTGAIANDSMIIKWDGTARRAEWDKDLSMYQAFRVSSVPYFQEVARRVGKEKMQLWLDSIHYGNKKIAGPVDSFWLNNSLKITPDEQLGLVKRLYFNQLPFFKNYQMMVKNAMLFEDKPAYKLSYKTGLGRKPDGTLIAWVVGWIEENSRPYLFVLNMEAKDPNADLVNIRMQVLRDILTQLGFFEGRK